MDTEFLLVDVRLAQLIDLKDRSPAVGSLVPERFTSTSDVPPTCATATVSPRGAG